MAGKWTSLKDQPTFKASTMMLLTDGRVMVQEFNSTFWHALTPDSSGSYTNGSWSTLAAMSISREFYASGVLIDGRVFVCGGEYAGGFNQDANNTGEIYNPVIDSWAPITPAPSPVGDAPCCVLPDGRVLIGALSSGACLIYNATTDSWTPTGSQPNATGEQTWILLPDNTILGTQCYSPYGSQKYVIALGAWQDEGAIPVTIIDTVMHEIGPGMLLYNGKTIYFGAANSNGHGKTAIYSTPAMPTGQGTWTAGPDLPVIAGQVMVCNDSPGTLMPNGKVIFVAAPFVPGTWGFPVVLLEYDPSTNTITQPPAPPVIGPQTKTFHNRLLLLPNGEVLFAQDSNSIQVYVPDGGPQNAWRPTISSVTPHNTLWNIDYFLLQGTQLNGLSQANIFGDDCAVATNYPLVQLTNTATKEVVYCRTYDFSTMGVATGPALESCRFDPSNLDDGTYDLRVIANGISSHPYGFLLKRPQKPRILDGLKLEFEFFGKLANEVESGIQLVDPEIQSLRMELKLLQNTVKRLNSLISARDLPLVGEDIEQRANALDKGKLGRIDEEK
jgi:Kelch motif